MTIKIEIEEKFPKIIVYKKINRFLVFLTKFIIFISIIAVFFSFKNDNLIPIVRSMGFLILVCLYSFLISENFISNIEIKYLSLISLDLLIENKKLRAQLNERP